jgi:hypothetical protein
MKKTLLAFCFSFVAVTAMYAQDTTATENDQSTMTQDQERDDYADKDVIAASELPAMVREQLQSQDYRGWTVNKAWRKMKDGQTMYAVELTSGDDKKKIKFDAQGNILKEKHKDH